MLPEMLEAPQELLLACFFVVVIAKDKAQQESRHHNVPNAQHREVTACGAWEDQFSRRDR
jgi:hypothetical protein